MEGLLYSRYTYTPPLCKEINRRFIGIEINPEYHKISVDRLNGITADGQIGFMFNEDGELL